MDCESTPSRPSENESLTTLENNGTRRKSLTKEQLRQVYQIYLDSRRDRVDLSWVTPRLCFIVVVVIYSLFTVHIITEVIQVASKPGISIMGTRWLFLRSVFATYFLAYASVAVQITGLIGQNGIIPTKVTVGTMALHLPRTTNVLVRLFIRFQIWLWWGRNDRWMKWMIYCCCLISLLGVLLFDGLSDIVVVRWIEPLLLLLLFVIYSSVKTMCRDFMSLQWDALLLEVGLYSICLSLMPTGRRFVTVLPSLLLMIVFRFISFRLMFGSGIVKIMSGDQSWNHLTAMSYHYLTQPLPNRISWYMHHLPGWCHVIETVLTFVFELGIPFIGLIPGPIWLRPIAFLAESLLFATIAATGNYGFFHVLSLVVCFSKLDDRWLASFFIPLSSAYIESTPMAVFIATGVAVLILVTVLVISGVPICNLSRGRIEPFPCVSDMNTRLSPLNACHSYGLFATMTRYRHELVFEGSRDGKEWIAFQLPWKPGHSSHAAPSFAPLGHMPRLDWRLWFLPLNNSKPSWFEQLCYQLLNGSSSVFGLFHSTGPFSSQHPPKYIRVVKYAYVFSQPSGMLKSILGQGGRDSQPAVSPSDYWHSTDMGIFYGPISSMGKID